MNRIQGLQCVTETPRASSRLVAANANILRRASAALCQRRFWRGTAAGHRTGTQHRPRRATCTGDSWRCQLIDQVRWRAVAGDSQEYDQVLVVFLNLTNSHAAWPLASAFCQYAVTDFSVYAVASTNVAYHTHIAARGYCLQYAQFE